MEILDTITDGDKTPNSNTKFADKAMFRTNNVDWKYPCTSNTLRKMLKLQVDNM